MYPIRPDIDRIVAETFIARAEYHPTLRSTNDRASVCAAEGRGELPLLIVAERQTAGRGRAGNRWWTGSGSLAFSLLLEPSTREKAAGRAPLVSLAAGIAVVETVLPRLPAVAVGIHWPNDVFAAGRKLAGILVEALPDRRQIIGIGLNTNNSLADAPPELQPTATTLRELTGQQHDHTEVLLELLTHLEAGLRQLAEAPAQIGLRADALCLQHGRPVTLHLGKDVLSGTCAGIAPDGALLLDTPAGRRCCYSGSLR